MNYKLGAIRKFKVPYDMKSEGRVFYEKKRTKPTTKKAGLTTGV